MNLTNSQYVQEMRRISVDRDLNDFKELKKFASKLDDKNKMANNIDETRRKLNELKNIHYEDFSSSVNKVIYESNLESMEKILVKESRTFQDIVTIYQASTECDYIYKRFRGEINE